jgi:hypothetical protein
MSSFYRGSSLFQSASPLDVAEIPSLHGDLISFVAQARALDIDELPFSWQSTLDPVGTGASAEVRQSLVSEELSFAFKHIKHNLNEKNLKQSLVMLLSELCVLGFPLIREHRNIIHLEGFCWEAIPDKNEYLPVLIFKESVFGDLGTFQEDRWGEVALGEKLKICTDIGLALRDMHEAG